MSKQQRPMSAPVRQSQTAEPSEVGDRFSLTVERHASKPLWRMRERSTIKGKVAERCTDWMKFQHFAPDIVSSQGRLKAFLFPDLVSRRPIATRRA